MEDLEKYSKDTKKLENILGKRPVLPGELKDSLNNAGVMYCWYKDLSAWEFKARIHETAKAERWKNETDLLMNGFLTKEEIERIDKGGK